MLKFLCDMMMNCWWLNYIFVTFIWFWIHMKVFDIFHAHKVQDMTENLIFQFLKKFLRSIFMSYKGLTYNFAISMNGCFTGLMSYRISQIFFALPVTLKIVLVKKSVKNKTCSIFHKTLSKVFLNNFHALNRVRLTIW